MLKKRRFSGVATHKGIIARLGKKTAEAASKRNMLAHADDILFSAASGSRGKTVVNSGQYGLVPKVLSGKEVLTKTFKVTKTGTVQLYRSGSRPKKVEQTSKTAPKGGDLRTPVSDFRVEAKRIGVPVIPISNRAAAIEVAKKIARTANDLFPDAATAEKALVEQPLDQRGRTGVQLIEERGAAAVLIKLEQMRFGFSG